MVKINDIAAKSTETRTQSRKVQSRGGLIVQCPSGPILCIISTVHGPSAPKGGLFQLFGPLPSFLKITPPPSN